ncbi:LysE family transporter [Escherichia coli]
MKGLLTNLANPKAIIYFGSVFSLFVGDNVGTTARWGIFALIIVETLAWFTVVASLLPCRKCAVVINVWRSGLMVLPGVICRIWHSFDYFAVMPDASSE